MPGNFCNVVLEKDGEVKLGRSCEKLRSITKSQGGQEYRTCNEQKEDLLARSDLAKQLLSI